MTEENKKLLQKEIPELMKTEGEERAADIKYSVEYVKKKEGENGFNDLLKELKKYGFKLPDLRDLSSMNWVPRFLDSVFLVGIFRFFDWSERDVFEMGEGAVSSSPTFKIFLKWFSSVENTVKKVAERWNKYFTKGSVDILELDKNKKQCLFEIKDFEIHPIAVIYLRGVFTKILEFASGSKSVNLEYMENISKYKYHKFKAKW